MSKTPWTLVSLLVACVVINTSAPVSSAPVSNSPSADAPTTQFWTVFKRKLPPPRGSRGGLCPISPGQLETEYVIWSDRPLFLWQANVSKLAMQRIEVFQANTEEIVWEQELAPTNQFTHLSGKALQPGQVYVWQVEYRPLPLNSSAENGQSTKYQFRVMDTAQRNQIEIELQQLTQPLQAAGASFEAIALQQANYFANKGLLSDALQVLYSIDHPSAQTTKLLQQLTQSICTSDTTTNLRFP